MRPSFRLPSVALISAMRSLLAVGFAAGNAFNSHFDSFRDFAIAGILWSYAATALIYAANSKQSWVFETRWLRTVHAVDWLAFALLIASSGGITSPYFPMFVLILFAASRALGVHRLLPSALAMVLTFGGASLVAYFMGKMIGHAETSEIEALVARVISLLAVAITGITLSLGKLNPAPPTVGFIKDHHLWADAPRLALEKAASLFGSDHALIFWCENDQIITLSLPTGLVDAEPTSAEDFRWEAGVRAISISGQCELRYLAQGQPFQSPLGANAITAGQHLNADEFLQLGFAAGKARVMLFLVPPKPMSETEIMTGFDVRDAVVTLIDNLRQTEMMRLHVQTEERAVLARNLHDSAIQSLASIRLHAASLKLVLGKNGGSEEQFTQIAAIDEVAGSEAQNLRSLVSELEPEALESQAFRRSLEQLTAALSRQWQVDCRLDPNSLIGGCKIGGLRAADITFVIRETVSNAVRHGDASGITVRVDQDAGSLKISIENNGRNQPEKPGQARSVSRSIEKRIAHIGGVVEHIYGHETSTLAVAVPLG